jgi:hypothetical protein
MRKLIALSIAVAACAGARVPMERANDAEASYRAAEEAGAESVPAAAPYLTLAANGIARARELIEGHHNAEAARVLERARADSELALGLTQQAKVSREARKAMESSR